MKKTNFLFIIVAITITSCEKVKYYGDNPLPYSPTLAIAHRAGGHDTLRDNTLESAMIAFNTTSGIETDVELSKDRTVWLSHNSKVVGCNGEMNCFAETRDSEIEKITTCNGVNHKYTKLADVMNYMDQHNVRKYISIDMKGWVPCGAGSLDVESEMKAEVEEIIKLGEKYNLADHLLFENEYPSVLHFAKQKNSSVKTFITSYGDYEKGMLVALKENLNGITYKSHFKDELDIEKMNFLHKKGLMLMAWNIPDSAYINYLRSIDVDIIQIDLK
jgi:glycerophosphoryl diester phosphodiesterase